MKTRIIFTITAVGCIFGVIGCARYDPPQVLPVEVPDAMSTTDAPTTDAPSSEPINLLAQWSGCMNLQDWEDSQMGSWANKNAGVDICATCHLGGLSRFNTNGDSVAMFEANRLEIFIQGFFTIDNAPEPHVVQNLEKLVLMGQGDNQHPLYNINANDAHFLQLQIFYDLTKARVEEPANPRCDPAQFPTSTSSIL